MEINLTAPINKTSYGYVSQNLIKEFLKQGHQISLRPIGIMEPDIECGYDQYINKCNPQFFPNTPHLIIFHQFALQQYLMKDCLNIGFPIFELDRFNETEIEHLNSVDMLFTPSQWSKGILETITTKPVHIVNLGVDPDVFFKIPQTPHPFISFLSIGKWEIRKNQIAIAKAFKRVFVDEGIDNARLTFVCHNDFSDSDNQKWSDLMKTLGGNSPYLNVLPYRLDSQVAVNRLLNEYDVGVFPSHAEGWGLETNEMLYLGKECIVTDYSAHTEFCKGENAHLIAIDSLEDAYDGKWFFGNGQWAKFGSVQFNELCHLMKKCYEKVKKNRLTNTPKHDTISNKEILKFTWKNSVNTICEVLKGK